MRIAICDDEKSQRELMEKHVREWAEKENKKIIVYLFENSEQFWFHWSEDRSMDIVLLDIQMGKLNGMELAKKIRKQDENLQIIFVTGIADYITEGYEVEALHYLLKPIDKNKLFQCLNKALMKDKSCGSKILIETKQGVISASIRDIWYLESFGHQCMIHLKDTFYEVRDSIGKLEEKLDGDSFIRCHRSYLINLKHCAKIEKDSAIMDDGRIIPISRNSYKAVIQAFIGFYRRNTNG